MDLHNVIEDAVNQHFPDCDIAVFHIENLKNNFQINITQKDFDFAFFMHNNYIQGIQSKYDYFDKVEKLLNFDLPTKLDYVNEFIKFIYEKSKFNKIFEPFNLIPNESMYHLSKMKKFNHTMIHNLSEASLSKCRLDKKDYSIYLNSSFKITKNKELIATPTLSFFQERNIDFNFEIAFNIEKQTVHLVKSYPMYYDDFFEDNEIFNVDKHMDFIFNSFIDNNVMKRIDPNGVIERQLSSLGDDIDTKIKLLLMYSI